MTGARFQIKHYASEAVAFDTASGDTHYLPPLALALYQLVQAHPGLTRDDARRLLAHTPSVESAVLDGKVDETLDGLRKIGLIDLNEAAATLAD